MPSSPIPSAPAPATPATAAAPPSRTERRSNLETIGPPSHRTHRTPRRFSSDVSAQDPLRGGGTVAAVSDWDLPGFSAWLGGRAAATRRAYLSDVTLFAEWMSRSGVESPAGVDRLQLRRYLAFLGTRQLARVSIARKAAALRCYFSWQVRQGRLDSDPARSLRAPSGGGRLPRVLSSGEVSSLLDAPTGTPVDRRDMAVLELLYAAGLRVSELCGLDRGDIDLRGRTVTVLGKGGKERRVPLHDEAVGVLKLWLEEGRRQMEGTPEAVFVNQRGSRL